MPTFKITTSIPSVTYDYYEVEASTEEEAIDLIMSGETDSYDSEVETEVNSLEIVDVIEIVKIRFSKKQADTTLLHIFNYKKKKI